MILFMERVILHCDCNSFFASVETALHPEYKGVPMAVCGSVEDRRGIVLAKNELAKKYNISMNSVLDIKVGDIVKIKSLSITSGFIEDYTEEDRFEVMGFETYGTWNKPVYVRLIGDKSGINDQLPLYTLELV